MNNEDSALLQKIDPIKKQGEVSSNDRGTEFSPMSPPEAHAPPSSVKVEYEEFHPYLRLYVDEHNELKTKMDEFQNVVKNLSITKDVIGKPDRAVRKFYKDFMADFTVHNQREEQVLFPLLAKRFLEIGEHSKTTSPITPIDVMKGEHLEALKIATEAICVWDLVHQIFDPTSQAILLGNFIRKSYTLLEMMRLHIYREDEIVFSLGQRHLTTAELDGLMELL